MQPSQQSTTRKKVLLWGAALIGSVTVLKFFFKNSKPAAAEKETVTMLTEDGRLVEVDKKLLASSGKKASNKELQQWIKK